MIFELSDHLPYRWFFVGFPAKNHGLGGLWVLKTDIRSLDYDQQTPTCPRPHARRQPNPLDVHIGNRLRLRRVYLGITQKDLATLAGISHQQIQQYEIGGNRISAQRLWIFSRLLNVPVGFFFEDMDKEMIAKVFSMLPVSDFRDLCIDECKIEERSDIQELVSAYMRLIRSRRKPLAECFLRLIDEISRTPGHEGEVSLRACLGTKLAGLK